VGNRLLFFYSASVVLKGKGIFGDKIPFVLSKRKLNRFLTSHPNLDLL
jgi:hypothetical protein